MSGKRIVFTGGSGKAGRHIVPHLIAHGYDVLNVDRQPLDCPGVWTMKADLTDSGQAFNALTAHHDYDGFERGRPAAPPDAVVHFAAIPRVLIEPDNVVYSNNVLSAYNVIEAAMKLGVPKVIIASSETVYGVCFAEGERDFPSFPLDEDYPGDPQDSYGLAKVCSERTARGFALRYNADIYALRIGNVIEPHEYGQFRGFLADPPSRKRVAWSYVDARDLGEIVRLALEKDGLGFQVFNATNDTITLNTPTMTALRELAPNTPITREMERFEAPLSNRKAREVLGFKEAHNWRKYVEA